MNKFTKTNTVNLGSIICLIMAFYFLYFLLIKENVLPSSISTLLSSVTHWHILVVGLLPIYIAFMIFGTSVAGFYLGSFIHRWLSDFFF